MSRTLQPPEGKVERDSSPILPEGLSDTGLPISDYTVDSDVSFFAKKTLPPASPLSFSDDEYHMSHKHRGKAIIFNHELFGDNLGLKAREGTKADRRRLKETFKKLGFVVQVLDDPNKKSIIEKLNREQENHYHYSSDCLVVVVLSHGDDGGILHAHDMQYSVSELWAPFMADSCPALAAKPKIFIIQACRGDSASPAVGVNAKRITTDSKKMPSTITEDTFTIPSEADILVAYSTYEGRVAYRDTDDGTWYINELCEELDQNAKTDDMLTMLTRVNRRVALTKENAREKQMPSLQSTLTRRLYFNNDREKESISKASLNEMNTKLDRLIDTFDGAQSLAFRTSMTPSTSERNLPGVGDWEKLRLWPRSPVHKGPLPEDEAVLRHAKALKMFLEWRKSQDIVQENGKMILTLLSCWMTLDANTRLFAHRKTVSFLREHAKEWPIMAVMDVPDLKPPVVQTDGTLKSRKTSLKSSGSSQTLGSSPGASPLNQQKARRPFK